MLSGSWKTTVLGVAALLSALGGALTALLDGNPQTSVDLGQITSALAGQGYNASLQGEMLVVTKGGTP